MAIKSLIAHSCPFQPPVIPDPSQMVWTISSLRTFRKCKRRFFWKYMMRLRRVHRAAPLLIGAIFHEALAKWYGSKRVSMKQIALSYAAEAIQEIETNQEFYDQDEYDKLTTSATTLAGMLMGYARTYKEDRKNKRVSKKHIEVPFMVDIAPELCLAGKIDLLLPESQKTVTVVEHKTTSTIRTSYIDRLSLDSQIQAYILGAREGLGYKVNKVLYNVVRKCRLRRKANETADALNERIALDYQSRPDFYFFREELKCHSQDGRSFKRNVINTHKEFCNLLKNPEIERPEEWVPTDTICDEFFRNCPFLPLCLDGLDKGTARLFQQSIEMHNELQETE